MIETNAFKLSDWLFNVWLTNYLGSWVGGIQLHTGSPGLTGIDNQFADHTKSGNPFITTSNDIDYSIDGVLTSASDTVWNNLSASGKVTHISLWDEPNGSQGNFLGAFRLSSPIIVNIGDTLVIPAGTLVIDLKIK